ncbi:MAG: UDP-glucose/GDP-mannose dehydrogenase family protein [Pirellulales bacterium]
MRVSIAGTGYVGLVTGVCLAEKGHTVTCVDVDADKVARINAGQPPIYEAGLEALLTANLHKRFTATHDLRTAVLASDITLIAVGTPFDGQQIDLAYVKQVAAEIGAALADKPDYHLVIVKSTVVPGTTDNVVTPILEQHSGKQAGRDFGVGTNPEFLSEGTAIADFLQPDRIVLGGNDERSRDLLASLYDEFPGVPRVHTSNKAAEMIKYASNSLLATMISYANEIGNLCSTLGGVDVVEVMRGVHLSQYLSTNGHHGERSTAPIASFLSAGCGFGGSCLPKDVAALIRHGEQAGAAMPLLSAVLSINQQQPHKMLGLLKKHFPSLRGVRVAVLGLAFKPETDDMRLSPAIPIVQGLLAEQAVVKAYDPIANAAARRVLPDPALQFCGSLPEALAEAEAVLLITRWDEFQRLPDLLANRHPQPVCIDGRRMIPRHSVQRYEGMGV